MEDGWPSGVGLRARLGACPVPLPFRDGGGEIFGGWEVEELFEE
jgi:hypothetical protein